MDKFITIAESLIPIKKQQNPKDKKNFSDAIDLLYDLLDFNQDQNTLRSQLESLYRLLDDEVLAEGEDALLSLIQEYEEAELEEVLSVSAFVNIFTEVNTYAHHWLSYIAITWFIELKDDDWPEKVDELIRSGKKADQNTKQALIEFVQKIASYYKHFGNFEPYVAKIIKELA